MGQSENYLRDFGSLLKGLALATRRARDAARGTPDESYETGRLMALHEVVSLMQQQATAFGIPLDAVSLNDINPERDLV